MQDKDIIKLLKDNKKAVCHMNKDLREIMLRMDFNEFDCLQLTSILEEPEWDRMKAKEWPSFTLKGGHSIYRLRDTYQEELEIIECEILPRMIDEDDYIQVYMLNGTSHYINYIPDGYKSAGFKFEGVKQIINKDFGYSHNGIDILPFAEYDNIKSGHDKILNATHILFRKV